jgi:hypothetical protein
MLLSSLLNQTAPFFNIEWYSLDRWAADRGHPRQEKLYPARDTRPFNFCATRQAASNRR